MTHQFFLKKPVDGQKPKLSTFGPRLLITLWAMPIPMSLAFKSFIKIFVGRAGRTMKAEQNLNFN